MTFTDLQGTPNLDFRSTDVRFKIEVQAHEPDEIASWQYKLDVYDYKYVDSDGLPIYAVAGGNSWVAAFSRAGEMIEEALSTDHCIF